MTLPALGDALRLTVGEVNGASTLDVGAAITLRVALFDEANLPKAADDAIALTITLQGGGAPSETRSFLFPGDKSVEVLVKHTVAENVAITAAASAANIADGNAQVLFVPGRWHTCVVRWRLAVATALGVFRRGIFTHP